MPSFPLVQCLHTHPIHHAHPAHTLRQGMVPPARPSHVDKAVWSSLPVEIQLELATASIGGGGGAGGGGEEGGRTAGKNDLIDLVNDEEEEEEEEEEHIPPQKQQHEQSEAQGKVSINSKQPRSHPPPPSPPSTAVVAAEPPASAPPPTEPTRTEKKYGVEDDDEITILSPQVRAGQRSWKKEGEDGDVCIPPLAPLPSLFPSIATCVSATACVSCNSRSASGDGQPVIKKLKKRQRQGAVYVYLGGGGEGGREGGGGGGRGKVGGWKTSMTQEKEAEESLQEWARVVDWQEGRTGAVYTDENFPADLSCITGNAADKGRRGGRLPDGGLEEEEEEEKEEGAGARVPLPKCRCPDQKNAKLLKVLKDGPNQGRMFYGCAVGAKDKSGCGFFQWAGDIPTRWKNDPIEFMRFTVDGEWSVVNDKGFRSGDVKQGGLGSCWFLSALAVVAERPDLIARNVITRTGPAAGGMFGIRLFIDGRWKVYPIDGYLPLRSPHTSRRTDAADHFLLHTSGRVMELKYCKGRNRQLWPSLLEKAYSKAHGSYKAISGGHIAEGMFDLTSFPCEMLPFGACNFDSEQLWARLCSFQSSGFTMGASCGQSHEGLVGHHAYSVLRVMELLDIPVGQQKKISDFFSQRSQLASQEGGGGGVGGGVGGGGAASPAMGLPPYLTQEGVLRLIRLRNPWGCQEWKGSFGPGSSEWTPKLREALEGKHSKSSKGDGCFWMAYHDFLRLFAAVDVCKAHRGWFVNSHEGYIHRQQWHPQHAVHLRLPSHSSIWLHLSLIQPSTRGKAGRGGFWYSDISLLVLRLAEEGGEGGEGGREERWRILGTEHVRLSGQGKVHHTELILGEASSSIPSHYLLLPFSFNRWVLLSDPAIRSGRAALRSGALETAPFTLRVFSAAPVELREVPYPTHKATHSSSAFLVDQLLRALADQILLRDSKFFAPPVVTRDVGGLAGVILSQYECSGACLVVLENGLVEQELYVRCRFVLHTSDSSDWGSTHKPTQEPEWRVVGPGYKGIVGVLGSCSQMAQFELEAMGEGGTIVMDRLQVEALPHEQIRPQELDGAQGIFAWKKA